MSGIVDEPFAADDDGLGLEPNVSCCVSLALPVLRQVFIKSELKVGVIYVKDGQYTEEEILDNNEHSPLFDEFLQIIGDKVRLKGRYLILALARLLLRFFYKSISYTHYLLELTDLFLFLFILLGCLFFQVSTNTKADWTLCTT